MVDGEATPSVLVMDLGGVTCRWVPDQRLVALARLSGLPPATIDQQVFASGFDDAGERGQYDLPGFVAHLAGLLGLAPGIETEAALRAAWAEAFDPDEAVLDLLGSTRCRKALFTNNGPLLEAALGSELPAVASVFDDLLFSWRLGTTKPDPDAFEAATEALGVAPDQVLFADDALANVEAAEAAGWRAHHFRGARPLHELLDQLGLG